MDLPQHKMKMIYMANYHFKILLTYLNRLINKYSNNIKYKYYPHNETQ